MYETELEYTLQQNKSKASEIDRLTKSIETLNKATFDQDEEDELDELIDKWVLASQEMINSLLHKLQQQPNSSERLSLGNLLNQLGIDYDTIHYDRDEEEFY